MRYNFAIRGLHKLIVLFVLIQFFIGFLFDFLFSRFYPAFFMTIHKSLGLTLLLLTILLIIIRLSSKKVPYPKTMPFIQIILAKIVHLGLYLSLFTMSLSGFIAMQLFHSKWQYFYLFYVPNFLQVNTTLGREIFQIHQWAALIFAGLVILHTLAAFYHKYACKDQIMKKMW
ncbi:cytochrome b [Facilibium subflavum]|uniref:cytochrome b n=1 Tax=Facilibium subflavum TaxID=2219058 RepID=UPI000E64F4EF|nr:cytochrome b/b6 domain-containing protein [Facilibium subflavum]